MGEEAPQQPGLLQKEDCVALAQVVQFFGGTEEEARLAVGHLVTSHGGVEIGGVRVVFARSIGEVVAAVRQELECMETQVTQQSGESPGNSSH